MPSRLTGSLSGAGVSPGYVLAGEIALLADEADQPEVALWIRGEMLRLQYIEQGLSEEAAAALASGAVALYKKWRDDAERARLTRPPN